LGKLELARIGLEEFDTVGEAVACGKFAGEVDDVGGVDGEDAAGSGAAGEEREEGWAAADFKDDVAWLDGSCDRLGIGVEASGVGEHGAEIAKRVAIAHYADEIGRHTSELQSRGHLVCRLLLEKK